MKYLESYKKKLQNLDEKGPVGNFILTKGGILVTVEWRGGAAVCAFASQLLGWTLVAGGPLRVEFVCSPSACVGFLRVLGLLPETFILPYRYEYWCLNAALHLKSAGIGSGFPETLTDKRYR